MAFTVQHATELLINARNNGRLPHALLITGTEASGTHQLALSLAAELNGSRGESLDTLRHPMFQLVRPSSKSRRILIEDIRALEPYLALKAEETATKIVVIQEAERMMDEAANAFLKTLEEPPAQTLIILITEQPNHLLATILSRCIRMDLQTESTELRLSEIQERFLPTLCRAMAQLGSDIAALALRSEFQSLLAERKQIITDRLFSALKAEAKIIAEGTDMRDWESRNKDATTALVETEYLREREELLELLTLTLGQAVLLASHAPHVSTICDELRNVAARHSLHELLRRMQAVDALRSDLKFNVAEALALDARMLEIIGSALV